MKAAEHKKYLFEICEKIDLDLESPTCKKLKEHLAQCPDCAAYYDSLKKTIVLYRNYEVEMQGSRVTEILSRLDLEDDADAKGHLKIKLPKKPDA
ncbi:MAG: hypothetical protein M1469_12455 [Bacteroidetes bacterium]|jgi:predicted anti-sigma-YlaC factor YlaD|nr:hypothetical protein [Bacteroidota bacterium]